MKRLTTVLYSVNNLEWTVVALKHLKETVDPELTNIFVVDNGSTKSMINDLDLDGVTRFIRYEENTGANAFFHRWMTGQDDWFHGMDPTEFLAFFHCDLFIHEQNWDHRVLEAFMADPKLNLLGFAGSNEIDELGGRGAGTMLNYRGASIEGAGQGSAAELHGRRMNGLEPAAVLDHMSMVFRRTELEQLTPQEGHFAPHHFYDKILSCEVLKRGGHVAVLGIDCDHFSGGTRGGVGEAEKHWRQWLEQEKIPYDPNNPGMAVYIEAERRFKAKYIHNGFAPLRVEEDYSISRPHGFYAA